MIQLERVSLAFSGFPLFEDLIFNIQKGEKCGIVGRNGSGKSTLFHLISGEISPDKGVISIPKGYRIGYLKQHVHFLSATILQEAALSLPKGEEELLYKAEKILFGLGFSKEDLDKNPSTFSGGYHLRLNLAKVLISEPHCLLLDEPTNYLDILSIRWLTYFLRRWTGESLLISHDRDFLDSVTTHTMGIHRHKVLKIKGSTLDYYQQILLAEELHERTRLKTEKRRSHLQSYVDRFGAKASKASQARSRKKQLEREPVLEQLKDLQELSFSFQEAPFPGKKMLQAKNIDFSFTHSPLIHSFSIEIEKGERVALIGKNGKGKSTLLRLLSKELIPQQGVIEISEQTKIGYFGQTHIGRLNGQHTIEEEIASTSCNLNFNQIKSIAGLMMFGGSLSEKKIAFLSGGEKSRVLLGKIIAKPCNLLLLDEPTHHLDMESIEALIDALEDFSGTVVIVTHSELILRRLGLDKIIYCCESGQNVFLGGYDDFLEKVGWEEESKEGNNKNPSNPRREKAELLAKKNAILKPLEKEITAYENKLISLEEAQKVAHAKIEQGSVNAELVKEVGSRQKEIEKTETALYALYDTFEKRKKEFD